MYVCMYVCMYVGGIRVTIRLTSMGIHGNYGQGEDLNLNFWTHQIPGLDAAESSLDLPKRTRAALAPLLRLLSRFDIITLPNSREPKLFNLFHCARLAGVRGTVLELPNLHPPLDIARAGEKGYIL